MSLNGIYWKPDRHTKTEKSTSVVVVVLDAFNVGEDHLLDQIVKVDTLLPAQFLVGLGRITQLHRLIKLIE